MTKTFTIDRALTDKRLLGAALGDVAPWKTWLAVLRAAFGQVLTEEERALFHSVAGDRGPPSRRVRELWCVVGRRGGKSRIAAAIAVFQACFVKHKLSAGEVGYVLVLAASRDQARVVFEYIRGFFEASLVLKQEIDNITASEIRLKSGVIISIHANSFRSIRGRTLLAVVFDEVALWRDEVSAIPDLEVYRAVLPALMTSNGLLVGISTPYRRVGLLHQKWRDHYAQDGDDILVVQGPSTTFNPSLSQSAIDAAIADDPEGARSEWEATFRADLAAFLDDATIDAAIDHSRPLELPPRGLDYVAFVDPSGGRHDAFALCIAHLENEITVIDVVRGIKPPFDPGGVVTLYAKLLKEYGIDAVIGDGYSEAWVETAFKDQGISYTRSEMKKSQIYLESLPLFTRAAISIPDFPPLIRELRLLERQTHRGGKDVVDHPKRGSDDLANVVAGAAASLAQGGGYDHTGSWLFGPEKPPEDPRARDERVRNLVELLKTGQPVPF